MPVKPARWRLADRELGLDQPVAAGIVNATKDSMFSGARSETTEGAIADGRRLIAAGFEMLDVGALAARSGPPVPADQEAAALLPVVSALARSGVPVSADTFSPALAALALEAGAVAINDIGGGGEEMLDLVASSGCGYVLMHIEGPPRVDRPPRTYDDIVDHLKGWFADRLELASARGVGAEQIVVDPGLDFDLGVRDGIEILRRLDELLVLGRPLYVSLSRKDLIGAILGGSWNERWGAEEREWGTVAATALAVASGASVLRLHDASSLQAMRVAAAIRDR